MATHISGLKMRGFKSFKHTNVKFSPGFVCIAGPNGSGKSNIIDAIRFVMGELSLKSLRAKKNSELITQGCNKGEVTVMLSGDRKHEIKRAITEDGKTIYKLDGKKTTRAALIDTLRPYGFEPSMHNIIAQGRVQKIVEMNPKERREIIDSVSGISEFEEKKKEAMRELDRVENKINDAKIVMSEREGYLNELEKEKDGALSHMEATKQLKRAKASLAHTQLEGLEKEHSEVLEKYAQLEKSVEETKKDIEVLDQRIAELESEKAELSDKINQRGAQQKMYKELEDLKLEITSDKNNKSEREREIDKLNERIASLDNEKKEIETSSRELDSSVKELEDSLSSLQGEIDKFEKEHREVLKNSLKESMGGLKKQLEEAESRLDEKKSEKLKLESEISKIEEITAIKKEQLERVKPDSSSENSEKIENEINILRSEVSSLDTDMEKLFEEEKRLNKEIPDLDRSLLSVKEKLANVRASASPGRVSAALQLVEQMKEKNTVPGIHGAVKDLISFDTKYSTSIEAATGQRLNYVIVDTIDTATKIINMLKKQKAGRCTFIPLDVRSPYPKSDTTKIANSPNSEGFLKDFVRYDAKFDNAMQYVFGTTILVPDVSSAKKIGRGKARLVTIGGELLERSGIMTGGSFKASIAAKSQLAKLEKEAEKIKGARDSLYSELHDIREKMSSKRKEKAQLEVNLKEYEIKYAGISEKNKITEENAGDARKFMEQIKENSSLLTEKKELVSNLSSEIGELSSNKSSLQNSISEAEEKSQEELSGAEKKHSELLMKRSSLEAEIKGRQREKEIISQRISNLEGEKKKIKGEISEINARISELSKSLELKEAEYKKKEGKLKEVSSAMEKHFQKMKGLEQSISEIGSQRGKLNYELEGSNKELNSLEVKKATVEVRLTDLKAEFSEYADIALIDAPKEELSDMVKKNEQVLNSLGSVNLRAPELYDEKKKDIEDVKVRVEKLSEEREAVLKMIDEIETKKVSIFMETFKMVSENFGEIFGSVFPGEGILILDNPSDPFNSGLQMKVRDGNKEKYLESMSGGEKSLLALIFIFAIQLCKSAPFYVLDEADAALDKVNSKKMAELVKKLSEKTQFIVVSHKDTTLSESDVAIGVTMAGQEGSKIVGLELQKMSGK